MMASKLQVLAVNEPRRGKTGDREWSTQDVECITIGDGGEFGQAGRLRLPKELIGKVEPGLYTAGFTMARDETREGGGRLVARLVSLVPVPTGKPAPSPAPAKS